MGIEPLRLSLRTESKITLGATLLSDWLLLSDSVSMSTMFWVSFKAFRLQNIISENPRKAFERKSKIVFFHVKVLCKHPFIPFIVVLFEVDKKRWFYGSPSPFKFQFDESMNQTKKGRKRKWKKPSDWKEPVFFYIWLSQFFHIIQKMWQKMSKNIQVCFLLHNFLSISSQLSFLFQAWDSSICVTYLFEIGCEITSPWQVLT